jgi:hypothetical protein
MQRKMGVAAFAVGLLALVPATAAARNAGLEAYQVKLKAGQLQELVRAGYDVTEARSGDAIEIAATAERAPAPSPRRRRSHAVGDAVPRRAVGAGRRGEGPPAGGPSSFALGRAAVRRRLRRGARDQARADELALAVVAVAQGEDGAQRLLLRG